VSGEHRADHFAFWVHRVRFTTEEIESTGSATGVW